MVALAVYAGIDIIDAMNAMKYYKYGPRYGQPLKDFENRRVSKDEYSSMSSRVVSGSLLVKTAEMAPDWETLPEKYSMSWPYGSKLVCVHWSNKISWVFPLPCAKFSKTAT